MLIVGCIKWGDKYSAEYVNRLFRAVQRNLTVPHTFVCYTDNADGLDCLALPLPAGHIGWWYKLFLFSLDRPVLVIDLDVVILRNIDALVCDEFRAIKDPWQSGYNSSVVMIPAGMGEVWEKYLTDRPDKRLHGDQDWLNIVPGFSSESCYPPDLCKSYKAEVRGVGLGDTALVYFHGDPKPHRVDEVFVKEHWI